MAAPPTPNAPPAAYLDWLTDVFEEAQVPHDVVSRRYLDVALRRIAKCPTGTEEQVYRILRDRWLRQGAPGHQLLAGLLRDEVYARRDSPLRPTEGHAYYTNDYQPTAILPNVGPARGQH
ncbi:MAG: hypothetical protein EXR69_00980 [Myxococcales bacterium]|nr:hypothetical protein [Myxococcales bacterium]